MVRILGLAFSLLLPLTAPAQWHQIAAPAGTATTITKSDHSGRLYAGTSDGVFVSTDHGASWSRAGFERRQLLTLTAMNGIEGDDILMASVYKYRNSESGIYRSSDGGASWACVKPLRYMAIGFFQANDTMYAVTLAYDTVNCILRSIDSGGSWQAVAASPPGAYGIQLAALCGRYVVVLCGDRKTVWRYSLDNDRWESDAGFPKQDAGSLCALDSMLLMGTWRGLFISRDYGTTWTKRSNSGILYSEFYSVATNGRIVLATTDSGNFISSDTGSTWDRQSSIGQTTVYADSSFFMPAPELSRSIDGIHWERSSRGIMTTSVTSLASLHDTLFASGQAGIYRRIGTGNWSAPTPAPPFGPRIPDYRWDMTFARMGDALYAYRRGLWKWHDTAWVVLLDSTVQTVAYQGDRLFAVVMDASFSKGVYYAPLIRSSDGGLTWQSLSPPTVGNQQTVITGLIDDGRRLTGFLYGYLDTDKWGRGYYVDAGYDSWDFGDSWVPNFRYSTMPQPSHSVVLDSRNGVYDGYYMGLWYSQDTNNSFVQVIQGGVTSMVPFLNSVAAVVQTPIDSFGNRVARLFFVSGTTVRSDPMLDSLAPITTFGFDNNNAYVVTTNYGIWATDIASLGVSVSKPQDDVAMLSVYPNPSKDKIDFTFPLPARSYISLKLYDTRGTLRATVFEGEHDAGDISIPFLDVDLPNGVYEAVLTTPSGTQAAKLVIDR